MSDDSRPNLPPFPLGCRASGLLLHVTSLPSPYGIGDVGPAAIAWIDQLHEAKQSWWQALLLGLGHLPYRKRTFEDYIGVAGRKRLGQKKWEQAVKDVVARLIGALEREDVVLGGGNVNNLKSYRRGAERATTPTHSWEDFAFGRKSSDTIARPRGLVNHNPRA